MTELISQLINLIPSFIAGFMLFLIISNFLSLRKDHIVLKCLALLPFNFLGAAMIYSGELTGTLFSLAGFFIIIFLFFKGTFISRISTVLIFYPLTVAISFLTEDIGFLIWCHLLNSTESANLQQLVASGCMLLKILFWYLILRFTKSWIADVSRTLNLRMWLLIDIICFAPFISIITVIYNSDIDTSYIAYPAAIACIITSLGCLYVCHYIFKTLKADMEINALKYQASYYQELEYNQQHIRKLRHDMKNHLNIIHTYLNNEASDDAADYLAQLSDRFTENTRTFCENTIINAVLNAKYSLAAKHRIQCRFQASLPKSMHIDDVSLCSLLSNTLDNAIEACTKIPDASDRHITMKAHFANGHFSYEITNTKQNEIKKKNGRFQTDKDDLRAHGLGLTNVYDIAAKYQGTLDIAYDESNFTLTAFI